MKPRTAVIAGLIAAWIGIAIDLDQEHGWSTYTLGQAAYFLYWMGYVLGMALWVIVPVASFFAVKSLHRRSNSR